MSGIKEAEVRLKLERAIEAIQRQVSEAQATDTLYRELGIVAAEASGREAHRVLSELNGEHEAIEGVGYEGRQLSELRADVENAVREGDQRMAHADRQRSEADLLQAQSRTQMERAVALCQKVDAALEKGGFLKHLFGFDKEDEMARESRTVASKSLELQQQANRLLQSAADETRLARNAYDGIGSQQNRLQAESRRVEELARRRREAARIVEESERAATTARHEVESLCTRIEQLNHDKFAAGEYGAARADVDRLANAFSRSDFPKAHSIASGCMEALRNLCEKVASAQGAWEAARTIAANDMDAAHEELRGYDWDFVRNWAGDETATTAARARLDAARAAFDREDFSGAQQQAAAVLQSIRGLAERAAANKAKYDQREVIAEAVMNALYEQGYDAPSFYFAQKDDQGRENRLSDMTIFAKSPGAMGDMRMNVNLDGQVALEVQGVGEGEETQCIGIIRDLQERLGGEVDFEMVDWGRATGAESQQRVTVQAKEQVKEQVKERRRG